MIEGRVYDVSLGSDALVGRLLDIIRGPLPVDQGISLAVQLIFLRWHLGRSVNSRDIWVELIQSPQYAPDIIDRELAHSLRHVPQPLSRGRLLSKTAFAMCQVIEHSLSGHADRDLCMLRESFESVLGLYGKQGLRGEGEYMGPDSIVRLSAAIVGSQRAYIDPASGFGTTLRAVNLLNPSASLAGFDVSPHSLTIAEMRLRMAGCEPQLVEGDAFDQAHEYQGYFGGVIIQPPWNLLVDTTTVARRAELLGEELPLASLRSDFAWVELSLFLMAPGGRGAVFLTEAPARPGRGFGKSQRRLLDMGVVEAVIDFPQGGMAISTAVPTTLWILRKPDDSNRSSDVLLIDASTLLQRDRGAVSLNNDSVSKLASMIDAWRMNGHVGAPGYVAKSVEVGQFDLERKGMLPSLYLENAPEEEVALPEPPKRLISRLGIRGYKAFSEATTIDLAPLTLVYGANSAGKSSIIQSLLLLKQSVDGDHLVTQGAWTDVGNFQGISSGHGNADIELGIEYGSLASWVPEKGTADPAALRDVRFTFSGNPSISSSIGAMSDLSIAWGNHRVTLKRSLDGRFRTSLALAEPVMRGIATGQVLFPFEKFDSATNNHANQKRNLQSRESRVRAAIKHFQTVGEHELTIVAGGLLPSGDVEYSEEFRSAYTERQRSTDTSYTNRMARLLAGIGSELRSLLDGITYLGPLRSAPKRYYDRASSGDRPGDGYDTAMLLYNNSVVVEGVNEWLTHLEVPYDLQMLPIEAQAGMGSLVGDLVVMALTDTRSGVQVTPADVGYGVSQMLPIVVKLLAETESVVCIEQPETHLHPRLQARLADLFIASSSAEGQGNQLIVETHSEHLMLRVQRRIREGTLAPQDVAVLYVDQNAAGSAEVQRIRLSEEGEFLDEWPKGFFEDRLDEIFGEGS